VVPVHPNTTASTKHAVDRLRDANRKALKAAPQVAVPIRLDEQMHVIVLNTEVEQPKLFGRGARERESYRPEDVLAAKRRETRGCPERHMDGTAAIVIGAATVRHAASSASGLSSCAFHADRPTCAVKAPTAVVDTAS
jgi:hypothetical protein